MTIFLLPYSGVIRQEEEKKNQPKLESDQKLDISRLAIGTELSKILMEFCLPPPPLSLFEIEYTSHFFF